MLKEWNNQEEIDIGNNTEHDVKSYQVKKTIVKCAKVRIKWLKFERPQKKICWYEQRVCDAIKQT